jgi:hypothetical protein
MLAKVRMGLERHRDLWTLLRLAASRCLGSGPVADGGVGVLVRERRRNELASLRALERTMAGVLAHVAAVLSARQGQANWGTPTPKGSIPGTPGG